MDGDLYAHIAELQKLIAEKDSEIESLKKEIEKLKILNDAIK